MQFYANRIPQEEIHNQNCLTPRMFSEEFLNNKTIGPQLIKGNGKKPCKHNGRKQTGQDLCWKVHDPKHLLFHAPRLCMNYIITMLLFRVSCMSTHKILLYFARFYAGSTPQNSQQRTLPGSEPFPTIINYHQARNSFCGLISVSKYINSNATFICTSCQSPNHSREMLFCKITRDIHSKTLCGISPHLNQNSVNR